MITITSKKDGFRRCGRAHSTVPTPYSDATFSKKELAALLAEPLLVVVVTEDAKEEMPPVGDKTSKGK